VDGILVILLAPSAVSLVALAYGDQPGPVRQTREWWKDARPGRSLTIGYRVNPLLTAAVGPLLLRDDLEGIELFPHDLGRARAAPIDARPLKQQPSVSLILIELESLRHDVLFLRHQEREVMPTLNRLAASGLSFARAYAPSTHSNYADPAILSSLYPLRTRHHHYYSPVDPWPKALVYDVAKKWGYETAVVSSQNETWGGMDGFLKSPNLDLLFDSRSAGALTYVSESDPSFARFATESGTAGKLDDHLTVERAIDWIKGCSSRNKPFVLCMNLQTSHFPYVLPRRAEAPFQPSELNFSVSFAKYPQDKVPIVKNAYYNALHYIDQQLARLVAFLDQTGLRERTLLVIVGDNGECFYENGYCTHAGPPFEPAIHVPLIMNCPGTLAPRQEDYLTQGIDVVPTALRVMGLPLSPCFQGTDVLAADRLAPERRLAFIHNCTLVRATADAVVTAIGWKYVYDRKTQNGTLYDLRSDPGEQTPLQARYPEVAQTLHRILQRWRDVQLAYYARPEYYGIYYPPPPPQLSDADFALLSRPR
jgi:arylsulfatase A-like enzyme